MTVTENTDRRLVITGPRPYATGVVGLLLLAFGIALVGIARTSDSGPIVPVLFWGGVVLAGFGITFLTLIARVRLTLDASSQTATIRWTGRMKRLDSTHAFSDIVQIIPTRDSEGDIANIALVLAGGTRVPLERVQDQSTGAAPCAHLANAWLAEHRHRT